MQYEWWQLCLITLFKGVAWSVPIWSLFLAASWFMSSITKESVNRAIKKYTPKED